MRELIKEKLVMKTSLKMKICPRWNLSVMRRKNPPLMTIL